MKKDGYDGERSFAYANRVAEKGAGRIFMKNDDPKAAPAGLKKIPRLSPVRFSSRIMHIGWYIR